MRWFCCWFGFHKIDQRTVYDALTESEGKRAWTIRCSRCKKIIETVEAG